MNPDPIREQERWQRQAERDLDDARFSQAGARFNLACFLAQQAAEKSLKAYLYGAGRTEVRGHSIADLCDEAAEVDAEFATQKASAAPLDQFYIPTRYPNGLPGGVPFEAYGEADAARALALAGELIAFVARKLRREPRG